MPDRFRTAPGGYDPDEVDRAIADRDDRIERLEAEANRLSRMLVEQERRLRAAISGHSSSGPFGVFGFGPVEAALRILARIHARARRRAADAQRRALRDSVGIADRILELTRLREELGFSFAALAERLGMQLEDEVPRWAAATEDPTDGAGADEIRVSRAADRRPTAAADEAAQPEAPEDAGEPPPGGRYSGTVLVEVGPVADFAQLTGIEDAIGSIDGVGDVEIESFSDGRARLALTLWEECELVDQLKLRIPMRLHVRSQAERAIVLDAERAA